MINDRFKDLTGMSWDQAVAHNNVLFFEADALNDRAYDMLRADTLTLDTWRDFSEAKKKAEKKYREARQEWLRIKHILTCVERVTCVNRHK
ncbi:MAG TPA: hypothetical protein VF682_05190 [Pseudomonas sp.]